MKNGYFSYIKVNEENKCVITCGMEFKTFGEGLSDQLRNLLILKGHPNHKKRDREIRFDYVPNEMLASFYQENVYDYGDFCWVDYKDEDVKSSMSKEELCELLYVRHMYKPMKEPFIPTLDNRFLYFSHDDDHIVKVYMKDTQMYKKVINHKVVTELKGRKKTMADMGAETLDKLYDLCKQGVVIDFEHGYLSPDSTGVSCYMVGEVKIYDELHDNYDKLRTTTRGITLDYNARKKEWKFYD